MEGERERDRERRRGGGKRNSIIKMGITFSMDLGTEIDLKIGNVN